MTIETALWTLLLGSCALAGGAFVYTRKRPMSVKTSAPNYCGRRGGSCQCSSIAECINER